jgi:hypothetical protein
LVQATSTQVTGKPTYQDLDLMIRALSIVPREVRDRNLGLCLSCFCDPIPGTPLS